METDQMHDAQYSPDEPEVIEMKDDHHFMVPTLFSILKCEVQMQEMLETDTPVPAQQMCNELNEIKSKKMKLNEFLKLKRKTETQEQRQKRLDQMNHYAKLRRASETPEQREKRLSQMNAYAKQRRATETQEQREKRLSKMIVYAKQRRASETPEQREERNRQQRELQRMRRNNESPEQRQKRLEQMSKYAKQRRSSEDLCHVRNPFCHINNYDKQKFMESFELTRRTDTPTVIEEESSQSNENSVSSRPDQNCEEYDRHCKQSQETNSLPRVNEISECIAGYQKFLHTLESRSESLEPKIDICQKQEEWCRMSGVKDLLRRDIVTPKCVQVPPISQNTEQKFDHCRPEDQGAATEKPNEISVQSQNVQEFKVPNTQQKLDLCKQKLENESMRCGDVNSDQCAMCCHQDIQTLHTINESLKYRTDWCKQEENYILRRPNDVPHFKIGSQQSINDLQTISESVKQKLEWYRQLEQNYALRRVNESTQQCDVTYTTIPYKQISLLGRN